MAESSNLAHFIELADVDFALAPTSEQSGVTSADACALACLQDAHIACRTMRYLRETLVCQMYESALNPEDPTHITWNVTGSTLYALKGILLYSLHTLILECFKS